MTFQPRTRTPRRFARRPGKNKPQTKPAKRRSVLENRFEEEHVATLSEIAGKTLNSLNRLGAQKFAVAPFHEHYDRWLLNVQDVLSEFETNPAVATDDIYKEERSRLISDIKLALKDTRDREMSNGKKIRELNHALLDGRSLLAQSDREYTVNINQLAGKMECAVNPVMTNVGRLREELNRISRIRAGFLRSISKRTKTEKTTETTRKLYTTREELAEIERSFASEQERLKSEHEQRRRQFLEQITKIQRDIEKIDAIAQVDDSIDPRHKTCEALINTIQLLLQRKQSGPENPDNP